MPTRNPVHQSDLAVRESQRFKDFLKKLMKQITEDYDSANQWREDRREDYRLRYGQEWRNVAWPWPGASDFVSPMIDMQIERIKAQYSQLTTAVHPPVTALAADSQSLENANNVEKWFDWATRTIPTNFIQEDILTIDDVCHIGRGIKKTMYVHQTRSAPMTVLKEKLPQRVRRWIVEPARIVPGALTGEALTRRQFDLVITQIRYDIAGGLALDPADKEDQDAIDEVAKWLKDGAREPLTVNTKDVIIDGPGAFAVNPMDLIVPPETTSIEEAEHITHRFQLSNRQVRANAYDSFWNKSHMKRLLDQRKYPKPDRMMGSYVNALRQEQARREGIYDYEREDIFEFFEIFTWFDINKDGRDEKIVIVVSPSLPEEPMKSYAYVRPSGRWPFATCPFELNERRWYAPRGIAAKLRDLNKDHTMFHRMKQNVMMIQGAPTFLGRMNSLMNWKTQRWIPGQIIWTGDPQRDLVPIPVNTNLTLFDAEQAQLRAEAQQYIGVPDFANQNALSSLSEPRTATEISAIRAQSNQTLSLRGTLYQNFQSEVYRELFDLWQTYGPNQVWVQVTGEEPIELTKEDLQGQYLFQPTGIIGQTDPVLEAQKAGARLQFLMNVAANPAILGPKYEIDFGEALFDYMQKDDSRMASRILKRRPPEEVEEMERQEQRMANIQGTFQGMQAATSVLPSPEGMQPKKGNLTGAMAG